MSIIKTHDATLYGSAGEYDIILHPLRDDDLTLLYKWGADTEVNDNPIGNFWLQKMNIPNVSALYPGLDVRRLEAEIGEKTYWGRGRIVYL